MAADAADSRQLEYPARSQGQELRPIHRFAEHEIVEKTPLMEATEWITFGFLGFLGCLVVIGIPAWFVVDCIQRRRQGLPVLDLGGPACSVVLYQPDDVLHSRVRVDALSDFLSRLQYQCLPILAPAIRHPVDVVVGLRPGRRARFWIMPTCPSAEVMKFQQVFDSMPVPEVAGSVAFALCVGRGAPNSPPLPDDWRRVVTTRQGPTLIPDDVFQEIWDD